MLTEARREEIRSRARAAIAQRTLRTDAWWAQPMVSDLALGAFIAYATWAAVVGTHYYAEPYISPLYAPCIAANCLHRSFNVIGSFWRWSPALLIIFFPLGFRTTCYFYRRVYYRSFFLAPPACAVPEPWPRYRGESRFPFAVMNSHRYFFMAAFVLAVLHWWDFLEAFHFGHRWGVGVGTVLMGIDALFLSLYVLSCHAGRHLLGGHVDRFSRAPVRYRLWKVSSRLNPRHGPIAWTSLTTVVVVDLYVRLISYGLLHDFRVLF